MRRAIGEVTGLTIGTALGFSDWGTIGLAVALGVPVRLHAHEPADAALGDGAERSVAPIALATDTFSIAVMEIVDNGIMLAIPGAMHAGVGDLLFWGALSVALVIAGTVAYPVNRWLITKGKGARGAARDAASTAALPIRVVAIVAAVAAAFGTTVLIARGGRKR